MLSNVAMFVANRATHGAVDSITRWASWGAVAVLFCICASVFGVIALFLVLLPVYGAVMAACLIAAGSLVLGLVCLSVPPLLDLHERRAAERKRAEAGSVASTVEAVNVETGAAVDYFGPLQVVASAFLVGMKTGQQLRGSHIHTGQSTQSAAVPGE